LAIGVQFLLTLLAFSFLWNYPFLFCSIRFSQPADFLLTTFVYAISQCFTFTAPPLRTSRVSPFSIALASPEYFSLLTYFFCFPRNTSRSFPLLAPRANLSRIVCLSSPESITLLFRRIFFLFRYESFAPPSPFG